ncbi:DNA topoisomerase, type IA [Tanacetum coccineum]
MVIIQQQQQNALPENINVARVVFNEITESSTKEALLSPRDIDFNLVHAYLARRALDYLIRFNISPLLWRKLPGCQSAGWVRSVALALIRDRETEIDQFKPQEYWTIGRANAIENMAKFSEFKVVGLSKKNYKKTSSTPEITSTLQQDSASKLHFPSSYTIKLAQKLYEGIKLPDGKSTGILDEDSLKLYTLIWSRSIACQMEPSVTEQIQVDIGNGYGSIAFRATSSREDFPGYQAVYKDTETRIIRNDEDQED